MFLPDCCGYNHLSSVLDKLNLCKLVPGAKLVHSAKKFPKLVLSLSINKLFCFRFYLFEAVQVYFPVEFKLTSGIVRVNTIN